MDPREAFAALKSASVRVAKEGSVESVKVLREDLEKIVAEEAKNHGRDGWTSCIDDLKEYLLFPVILILKTRATCSSSLEEEAASLIRVVIENSTVEDFKFFQEVFSQLFLLLTHRSDPSKVRDTSEDCKSSVLVAAGCLVARCGSEVRRHVYGPAFRPQLGHAVHLTLNLAAHERSTTIKIQAITTLGAIGQRDSFPHMTSSEQHILSTTFTNFLPGVSTALTKVATASDIQNHRVTAVAIDVWSHLVVLVMRDSYLMDVVAGLGESDTLRDLRTRLQLPRQDEDIAAQREAHAKKARKDKFILPEPDEEKEIVETVKVKVTSEWVSQTSQRLQVLIESVSRLVSHSHWRVRLRLVYWAHNLLMHCSRSLSGSVVVAVEVLAGLRSDEMNDVSSAAQETLQMLSTALHYPHTLTQSYTPNQSHTLHTSHHHKGTPSNSESVQQPGVKQGLMDILEERIFALATQLPRVCRQQDDAKTLAVLRGMVGCMDLVGGELGQVLASHTHSHRLLMALSCLLTFDTTLPHLLQERTRDLGLTVDAGLSDVPRRSFQYFRSPKVVCEVQRICRLVGQHNDLVALVDLCLHLIYHTSHARSQIIFIMALILQGIDKKMETEDSASDEREHVIRSVLETVLSSEIFDATLYITPPADITASESSIQGNCLSDTDETVSSLVAINKPEGESVAECRNNVIQVWCALDVVGACAQLMGQQFQGFLSTVLCPVMEKAGEANLLVATAATNTLKEIAQACGHESIGELIQVSVPYFWYPLSLRLKRLSQYPSAPLVLEVCLHHAQLDVLAFTEELVGEVLASLDTHHNTAANPLIRVLMVYVKAVARYEATLDTSPMKNISHKVTTTSENENPTTTPTSGNENHTATTSSEKEIGKAETEQNETDAHTNESNRPNTGSGIVLGTKWVGLKSDSCIDDLGPVAKCLLNHHKNHEQARFSSDESTERDDEDCVEGSGLENFQNYVDQSKKNKHEEESEMENDVNDEKKKAVPRHIELVVEVMERSSHLLYLSDRRSRVLLLEVVLEGCQALARWEDQRLPILHKLWKPMMLRLRDKDSAVVSRVVEAVAGMLTTSGQFLRRRCLAQFLPPLMTFLRTQGSVSRGRDRSSGYYLTPVYRAQHQVLGKLANMVKCLTPGPTEIGEIVEVVVGYCDTLQPVQLCVMAQTLLTSLAETYPHHVWLALTYCLAPPTITPPSTFLKPIKICSSSRRDLPKDVLELYHRLC